MKAAGLTTRWPWTGEGRIADRGCIRKTVEQTVGVSPIVIEAVDQSRGSGGQSKIVMVPQDVP